ncbi:MAG: LysR family transcriptional regulator [Coriobacteriales bacterium]
MNIEALHYFIGLIQDGSFNKAAKRLFISPQGLNRAVSSLELQLGVSLIERGPSGVSPTPEGNIFLKHAMAIVERCSMADEILSYRASKMSASTKHLHITITPYLASVGLGRIWDMSSMNVGSVRELPLRRLLEEVPHSQPGDIFVADLFLKTRKKIRAIGELAFEPVFATRVGIIRSKAFPWKTKEPLRYADVAELPIAYTSDSTNNGLVAYLFKNAPLKNNCLQSSNLNTLLSWVHDRKAVSCSTPLPSIVCRKGKPMKRMASSSLPLPMRRLSMLWGTFIAPACPRTTRPMGSLPIPSSSLRVTVRTTFASIRFRERASFLVCASLTFRQLCSLTPCRLPR